MAAISELVQSCLARFTSLMNSETLSACTEVPLQEWRDELGRLRVWAANIGAHQTRQSSLDYRLRDSSHIRSQIVALLHQGQELLIDLNDVLEEQKDKESRNQDIDHIEGLSESETSKSEIQEIHEGLVATIGQLYQMSMLIRKPSYHDRLIGMKKLDSEPFQFWAKSHTAEKYPNADSLVIDRISSAMARQRAVLKYRERHHEKLSQGINPEDDGKSTILSETVVTDVFNEIPSQINDLISEAGVSETSYGGSLLDGSGSGAPRIPKLPKGAEEGPFECPYCFYIITVRDKRAWARHIFRDLMPYVCIFSGCETPNKLYESRRQWNHHIQQAHNATIAQGESYDCLICRNGSLPISNFQRHVGRHLEELALFLLPRTGEDDDEDEATDEKNEDDRAVRSTSEIYLDENLAEHITEDLDVIDKPTVLYKPVHVDEHSSVEPHNRSEDRPHSAEEYSNNSLSLTDQEKIDDRMHRLDNHERKSKMEKSEEGKGDPSRSDEMNTPKAMFSHMQWHEWEELEKIQAQYKAKIITKEGLERGTSGVEDDDEKREKELFSKAAAVEEWKQQRDQDIEYKLRYDFGYVEEEVEQILRKSKGGKETQEEDTRKEKGIEREKENEQLSEGRVTWIKVHRKHLLPETLITYNLPWDWDENDTNYIIIKKWIPEDFQEELFAHTRRIREGKIDARPLNSPQRGRSPQLKAQPAVGHKPSLQSPTQPTAH